ncbi:hypothetical protein AB0M79_21230 [Polymorphospora sp. NPDC051019]|uniref:hypothetical protein n=1 Tax=Polymorphospora sp. NPDC051019 TaxID=3155725 RepID=UPI00342D28EF
MAVWDEFSARARHLLVGRRDVPPVCEVVTQLAVHELVTQPVVAQQVHSGDVLQELVGLPRSEVVPSQEPE